MTKDYYKILEVSEFSTLSEIKSAYRRLARKWHPDVAGNSFDVITRFKEINEAYETLSDKVKKADYDTARRFYNYSSENKEQKTETKNNSTNPNTKKETQKKENKSEKKEKKGFSFNWEEFVTKKYQEAQYKKEQEIPKKGGDIHSDIEISISEAINGTTKVINMLQTQICSKCGGRKFVNGGICSACKGNGDISNYKKFSVRIPAGIKEGSKIRLAGEGEKGLNGGKCGDLYLTVHITKPSDYQIDGLNVLKTIQIAPYEAVLGTTLVINTLQGKVSVKIAPNTKNGQKIRLNNCGIKQNNLVGGMIVTVEIQIPKNLTNEEIELYKRLQDIASGSVREI